MGSDAPAPSAPSPGAPPDVQAVRSWAATTVFLPVFGAILVIFDVAQRLARLFGQRPQEYVAGTLQVSLVPPSGSAARARGRTGAGVPAVDVVLVVANHQSMFDIPILGALLFSNFPKYISKRELGRGIPSVSYNLRRGGHVLIDRGDAPSALVAIASSQDGCASAAPRP